LLLKGSGLYKTRKFRDDVYIGDPINAVKIFNDKEVDELVFLDIAAGRSGADPDFAMLKEIAGECFMPLSYGGGVKNSEMVRALLSVGIEKMVINSAAYTDAALIPNLAEQFGSSTIVGSIDVRKNWRGREQVFIHGGTEKIPYAPEEWAKKLEAMGVGEIMVNSIDRDGEMTGYELGLIRRVADSVSVPIVAAGGARNTADLRAAVKEAGASAAAAGAMFVFHGKHRAVLITYPTNKDAQALWEE
jgi:cyclase